MKISYKYIKDDIETSFEDTRAEISLEIDNVQLFRNKTKEKISDSIIASPYLLAMFFAGNYWRLLNESKIEDSIEWEMTHSLSSIGSCYVWPFVDFIRNENEQSITIISRPIELVSAWGVITEYFCNQQFKLSLDEFKQEMEDFILRVLQDFPESQLAFVWNFIQEDLKDSNMIKYRQIEASLGYERDEADIREIQEKIREI